MFKNKLLIIFIILISFFIKTNVFAISNFDIPVKEAFSDIKKDYKYYYELQTLYYKGIVFPEKDGKFHPDKLLNRDEFVAIAEETSCKKCIVPNTDLELLEKYKQKPFFDVGLNSKYFYCIADAKDKKFVLGYKPGDKCKDGTKKDGEIPFCMNNNITREEALAVVMRMGGILTAKQADIITSGIEKGQKYPDLALDMKPKNNDGTTNSFYSYFKKALEYEVLDYDNLGNKKIYKLVEKKGDYLRPHTYITKQDFLKMAFVALKANSCIDKTENTKAIEIKIYNKKCSYIKAKKGLCKDSDLKDPEDTFDFGEKTEGICKLGIDDKKGYIWRFYNLDTGNQIIKYGKYIDNYKFLIAGNYRVFLKVIDKCGDSGEVYMTLNIPGNNDKKDNLSALIKANPISGQSPLFVNFEAVVDGGKSPYRYIWDFGDGSFGDTKTIGHMFMVSGIYDVKLKVIDKYKKQAEALVSIEVLPGECFIDSDNDGVNNCDDKCKLISGKKENDGCPIFLPPSDDPENGASDCVKNQNNSFFIFGNVSCNSCPCNKFIDFRSTLRECDVIIPAITSKDEKNIYSRGKLFQIQKLAY